MYTVHCSQWLDSSYTLVDNVLTMYWTTVMYLFICSVLYYYYHIQEWLTLSRLPSMVVAASRISMRANWPGLHSSFSSWPIMTARASINTWASITINWDCFSGHSGNGPGCEKVKCFPTITILNKYANHSCEYLDIYTEHFYSIEILRCSKSQQLDDTNHSLRW